MELIRGGTGMLKVSIMESAKSVKKSTLLLVISLIIATIGAIVFATSYYSQSVFYMNASKYKLYHDTNNNNTMIYTAMGSPTIQVKIDDLSRIVTIDHQEFIISKNSSNNNYNESYTVAYPAGHEYQVEDQSGTFVWFNEKGEMDFGVSFYVNGKRQLQEGEEEYFPGSLVTAAYPQFHEKQGALALFILSWFVLIYGWCCFKYESFQNLMFNLSAYKLWVRDAEPSDFYYFMSKVSGIVLMVGSIFIFIESL
jgi:hypothetical protein